MHIFAISVMTVSAAMAQNDRQFIRYGNKSYRSHKYSEAENAYRKALGKNPNNPQAVYNLGCALMSQGNDSAAIVQFNNAVRVETDKLRRAKSYHNAGVIFQKKGNYGEAIEAYKNALRNNPADDDTRYNLILCKRLQQQQRQNQNDNNDNEDNKDKDRKRDKDKQNEDKDNKDKGSDKDRQQPKTQMERQNAEQLLNAAMQEEKATHERLKRAMRQSSRRNINNNW